MDGRCLMCCDPWLFFRCRPEDALIFLRDRTQPFVNEFLHALPAIGLGHVDVALSSEETSTVINGRWFDLHARSIGVKNRAVKRLHNGAGVCTRQ